MRRPLVASGALGLLVIVSRLPLLGLGYGSDMDGWRLAATARAIRSTRAYSVSRFPGFPVHEIVSALLWAGGPYALNGATAAMSVAACVVFREILRKTGCGHSLLGGLALGFVPAVFIYSTCPLDYVWALSLALGSFHCLLVGRWIVAGILLGLAAGCRISSLGLIVPFAFLAVGPGVGRTSLGRFVRFAVPCLLVMGASFVPVFTRYGAGFLTVYRADFPRPALLGYRASLGTWGVPGSLALLGVMAFALTRTGLERLRSIRLSATDRGLTNAAAAAIGVTLATFLIHPDKSVYLIPAVPFVLLIAWKLLPPRGIRILGSALIVSPFVLSAPIFKPESWPAPSRVGFDFEIACRSLRLLSTGPAVLEYFDRRRQLADLDHLKHAMEALPGGSLLVAGWWFTEISAAGLDRGTPHLQVIQWLDEKTYKEARARARPIYFAPGQLLYNRSNTGFDFDQSGVHPLLGGQGDMTPSLSVGHDEDLF